MKKIMFATACVLLALTVLVRISSSATYDPWADLDESGDIDIFDVVTLAGSYQTTGDPTKNVNVLNWPVTTQQHTVFWSQESDATSEWYNASGFAHMHLTWWVADGGLSAGELITVNTWARIYSPTGGSAVQFVAGLTDITPANDAGALTVPVPAERFCFHLDIAAGTTARVYLAFYLTHA